MSAFLEHINDKEEIDYFYVWGLLTFCKQKLKKS